MDYRHTEDFARDCEAAAIRAAWLRAEASAVFWHWLGSAIASSVRSLWRRVRRACGDVYVPEA